MLWADVLRKHRPATFSRAVADYFVSSLPVDQHPVCPLRRGGRKPRQCPRSCSRPVSCCMIFPEGTPGIGKPFRDRYQLQEWRVGHCELAIRYRAPVVPVAIVGAEEQMPQLARIPLPRALGVPLPPRARHAVPLPVRYHIHYGEPLRFHEDYSPDDADDPETVKEAAQPGEGARASPHRRRAGQARGHLHDDRRCWSRAPRRPSANASSAASWPTRGSSTCWPWAGARGDQALPFSHGKRLTYLSVDLTRSRDRPPAAVRARP